MTRLTTKDVDHIPGNLSALNARLKNSTGYGLLDIASKCYDVESSFLLDRMADYRVSVIPVSAGLGIITNFSQSLAAILRFLGFDCETTSQTDVAGFSEAVATQADAIFMADDNEFIAIDLSTKKIVKNATATGKVYATVLQLLAGTTHNHKALVLGCGPVGLAAADKLLESGISVTLFDCQMELGHSGASILQKRILERGYKEVKVNFATDRISTIQSHQLILDATPATDIFEGIEIGSNKILSLPGVPCALSERELSNRKMSVVHDTLELGVSAMAVNLIT